MTEKSQRDARRTQQAREVEESQARMRKSITETERLVDASEEMLRRHRQEREDDDHAPQNEASESNSA